MLAFDVPGYGIYCTILHRCTDLSVGNPIKFAIFGFDIDWCGVGKTKGGPIPHLHPPILRSPRMNIDRKTNDQLKHAKNIEDLINPLSDDLESFGQQAKKNKRYSA
jgi:hypothetical protein